MASFLVVSPLLALVVALAYWVVSLRAEVALLDQRVRSLEASQPLSAMMDVSDVGVPLDIDEAMQMTPTTIRH